MNANPANQPTIADSNVERLLTQAYRPEPIDPAFAARVQERMLAAAAPRGQGPRTAILGLEGEKLARVRKRLAWVMSAAAAAAAVVLIWHAANPRVESPRGGDDPSANYVRLTARPRSPVAEAKPLAVGEEIRTRQGQRRRVVLPDGSVLYVNQNSTVKIEGDRQLRLIRGEVFVEVTGEGKGSPFVVRTPHKEVTALGTKFAVRTDDHVPTQVLVTQGKVQVSGVRDPVPSGQELEVTPSMEALVRSAPRVSAVLDWARELMAAAEAPLVPGSSYAGGALVAKDPDGQEAKLSLRNYTVDVHIEDGFARTVIDQTYFNHNHSRIEGTFYFPLPPDASLSRLAMYVDGKLMEGGMADRDHARGVYERIVWSQKDPALLEWVDGSTFKMRVFPLEARQEKRIIIGYSQRLAPVYGRSQYRFPAGHSLGAVAEWSFQARVKNGTKLVCASDSHTLKTKPAGDDLLLETSARNVKLDRDVTLNIVDPRGEPEALAPGARRGPWAWQSTVHEDYRYVMLRYRPELPTRPQRQNRDWVFLFESSGDRDPLLARTQIEVLRGLLANAEHYDSFAVVTAATRARTFPENGKLLPVTPENVKSAIAFLESTHLIGALDLGKALGACAPLLSSAQQPHLVHLGSGVASMGERQADQLVQRIPQGARYVGVGVGKRWARDFMKSAAEKTGGHFTQINPDEPVSWRSFDLAATLNTPRLMNAKVLPEFGRDPKGSASNKPSSFLTYTTNLAHGEELLAIARLGKDEPLPASVRILGSVDGESFEQAIPLDSPPVAHAPGSPPVAHAHGSPLPRTWAKLEIDRLLAEDAGGHRKEITELSKAMYVMSPFTSLLVLENDEMYREHKIDRGRKDHWAPYVTPAKIDVFYEPEAGQPVDARFAPKTEKPHANAVLDTILVRVPPTWVAWPGRDRPFNGDQMVTALRLSKGTPGQLAPELLGESFGYFGPGAISYRKLPDMKSAGEWGVNTYFMTISKGHYLSRAPAHTPEPTGSVNFIQTHLGATDGAPFVVMSPETRRLEQRMSQVDLLSFDATPATILPMLGAGKNGFAIRDPRGWTDNGEFRHDDGELFLEGILAAPGRRLMTASSFEVVAGETLRDRDKDEIWNMSGKWLNRHQAVDSIWKTDQAERVEGRYLLSMLAVERSTSPFPDEAPVAFPATMGWSDRVGTNSGPGELGDIARKLGYIQRRLNLNESFADLPREREKLMKLTEDLGVLRAEESPYFDDARFSMVLGLSPEAKKSKNGDGYRHSVPSRPRLYERPSYANDSRAFSNLVSYAPGLNTSRADVLAVREAESLAGLKAVAGKIDADARELIERARQGGWRRLGPVVFDGAGRYAIERTISLGLKEQVVCDGKALLHLYPELGIGARRQPSRFHRAELTRLVPWLLPPVEDLAIGRDVRKVNDSTIALVPRHAETRKDEDGKPIPYLVVHLVFAPDGRLAERRLVLLPENKLLAVQAYDASGVVRFLDGQRELVGTIELPVREAAAPDLKPDASGLVVLPLPYRSRDHVCRVNFIEPWTLTHSDFAWTYEHLDQETALALFAAEFAQGDRDRLRRIHRRCFAANGVHKLGFYTFLVALDANVQSDRHFLDLVEKNVDDPLARYLSQQGRVWTDLNRWFGVGLGQGAGKDSLLGRLAGFRDLQQRWDWLRSRSSDSDSYLEQKKAAVRFGLEYVKEHQDTPLGWLMLTLLQDRAQDPASIGGIAEAWKLFAADLGYLAGYEEARAYQRMGYTTEAAEKYLELYRKALKHGVLPPLDGDFIWTLRYANEKSDRWTALVRQTADQLLQAKNRPAVVALAWQCWQLNDQPLAQSLLTAARQGLGEDAEALVTNLAAVEFLLSVNQDVQADEIISPMLASPKLSKSPYLWRIGAHIAERRGLTDWSISRLEQALDLEYQDLPDRINLRQVRDDYGKLLGHYRYLVDAAKAVKSAPPKDLAARTVRAADRWRALDREETSVCDRAAEVLQRLGQRDLAWDYLTTPVAMKPNESAPWHGLANTLSRQGDFALAELAFQSAFEAEPTDAQVLWDRGENLSRSGQEAEARKLLRQVADGDWQPRFNGLKSQARWRLEGR